MYMVQLNMVSTLVMLNFYKELKLILVSKLVMLNFYKELKLLSY